jgi:hypothetical protein
MVSMEVKKLYSLLILLSLLAAQAGQVYAGTVSYTIVFAFIPNNPSGTRFTLGPPRWIPGRGQDTMIVQEMETPFYSCELVKWSIKNSEDRYLDAPLTTVATSLFNYTNPIVQRFIRENISKLLEGATSNRDKINIIANYVYNRFEYQVGQYPHYPWETIQLGHGDCDDLAILVVTIARAYGVPSAVVTGLLVIPGLKADMKSGGINYIIRGVAGHAWIVYLDDNGKPVILDKLVPLNTVPDDRRIILDYPTDGYVYVNQTRSQVEEQKGKAYMILYHGSTCPSPRKLEETVSGTSGPQGFTVSMSDKEAVIIIGVLGWVVALLTYYIYASITRPYWSRW